MPLGQLLLELPSTSVSLSPSYNKRRQPKFTWIGRPISVVISSCSQHPLQSELMCFSLGLPFGVLPSCPIIRCFQTRMWFHCTTVLYFILNAGQFWILLIYGGIGRLFVYHSICVFWSFICYKIFISQCPVHFSILSSVVSLHVSVCRLCKKPFSGSARFWTKSPSIINFFT